MTDYNILWLRRDLRLHDNAALYRGLKAGLPLRLIFIFDEHILSKLSNKRDARVSFLHDTLTQLSSELTELGSALHVFHGKPEEIWKKLAEDSNLKNVFTNKDYERYAISRDATVTEILSQTGKSFNSYKDHVIFDRNEVLKDDGTPYTVFTPYKRKWLAKLESKRATPLHESYYFKSYPCEKYYKKLEQGRDSVIPSLADMGFETSEIEIPNRVVSQGIIKEYDKKRNFPAVNGTSKLGIHFRFGTISVRSKARKAEKLNDTYLSELVWRDFYSMILQYFPHVETDSFRSKYDAVPWRENEHEYKAWTEGKTGFPIVDAGMRELNATGYMHNRVRMIVASFFTKHLLMNWRKGERYFAEKLLDYDLASNSGGWQWAAGCGTDAAPYFRVFNPYTQATKFDKERVYIKKWVPEIDTEDYPQPIVEHKFARERCLEAYKTALKGV